MEEKQKNKKYKTSGGIEIYKIPVQAFPGWILNSYLILDDKPILVDPGTPFSIVELETGFKSIGLRLKDVSRCLITHAHFDHFMLIGYIREESGAAIYAHKIEADFISNAFKKHDEYHVKLDRAFSQGGMPSALIEKIHKREEKGESSFKQMLAEIDFTVNHSVEDRINGYEVVHTPGHSPGHICLVVDDFIFLGDHMLSKTTPHQMPTEFGNGYGLKKYISSLRKIREITEVNNYLGLAGHEDDIAAVAERAREIESFHEKRLDNVVSLCKEEKTAWQITEEYFSRIDELEGTKKIDITYQESHALTEILAHIEFLLEEKRLEADEREGIVYYRKS